MVHLAFTANVFTLFVIRCKIKFILSYLIDHRDQSEVTHSSRTAWNKATPVHIQKYKSKLEEKLNNLRYRNDAFMCSDIYCKSHDQDICDLYKAVVNTIQEAATVIPSTEPSSGKKVIPGWNEYVAPLQREALYWHRCWKAHGQPHQGDIAEMMRITRARYHRAVKKVKKDRDNVRMEKMAEAISNNNMRDLWSEISKIKGRNNIVASNIDGIMDSDSFADLFCDKYKSLYTSVPYNSADLDKIVHKVNSKLCMNNCQDYSVTIQEVSKAVSQLKRGKSGGEEGLFSDHIINGPHKLLVFLTLIYNAMLTHGITPECHDIRDNGSNSKM